MARHRHGPSRRTSWPSLNVDTSCRCCAPRNTATSPRPRSGPDCSMTASTCAYARRTGSGLTRPTATQPCQRCGPELQTAPTTAPAAPSSEPTTAPPAAPEAQRTSAGHATSNRMECGCSDRHLSFIGDDRWLRRRLGPALRVEESDGHRHRSSSRGAFLETMAHRRKTPNRRDDAHTVQPVTGPSPHPSPRHQQIPKCPAQTCYFRLWRR
jgi:hypothetical protein